MADSPGLFRYANPFFMRSLTIDHTQVPSTQTNFPVLFNFTDNTFRTIGNGGHVSTVNDILFYGDSAGMNPLKFEIERYTATTGEIVAWIKLPSISSASDTIFYIRYGDPSITTDHSDARSVWSNGFVCVYHLKDGTTLSMVDSANENTAINHLATATAGQIDGAAAFASASSQYIDCGTTLARTSVTISAWINGTTFPNAYNTVGGWNDNTGGTKQAMIWVKSTGKMTFFVNTGSAVGYDGTGTNTLVAGTTYYVTLTYDSTSGLVGYINAGVDGTAAANGILVVSGAPPFYIGRDFVTAGRFWNGVIDEVRESQVARSANWITCEYNNQKTSSTFIALGAET